MAGLRELDWHGGRLVIKALDMAYEQRGKPQQVLFHSDQGSQYASRLFRQRLWHVVARPRHIES